jgi:acyl dehydratase
MSDTPPPPKPVAERIFSWEDQERFAAFSGDRNPIHLDAVAARRTQAGAPVVHGIHLLLWCLDSVARVLPDLASLATLRVRFEELVYVGDPVETVVLQYGPKGLRVDLRARGLVVVRLSGTFGPLRPGSADDADDLPTLRPQIPADCKLEELTGRRGRVGFACEPDRAATQFPDITGLWGARRVSALACTTYLVGMVCPGLHSIFGGLSLSACEDISGADAIDFRVTATDARFRVARIAVSGGGLIGSVESFARLPPVAQASMSEVARHVAPGEFAGAAALVVGGSRGLGELTAKLLAAGGARVTVTYASGQADALRVRNEIIDRSGRCEILPYDVLLDAKPQLEGIELAFDTLYYFATPLIYRKQSAVFDIERFDQFNRFYSRGFYEVCDFLAQQRPNGISAFYPSSVFVGDESNDMTEYAMAKGAAEILCAHMVKARRSLAITVRRLPRLSTDQTASLTEMETADPLDIMLPIVREVHAKRVI